MPWSRRKRISDERQEAGCKGLTNAKDLLLLLMLIFFGFSETFFHLGHFTGPAASFLKPQGILPEMVPTRDLQSCPQSCSICTHVTPRNSVSYHQQPGVPRHSVGTKIDITGHVFAVLPAIPPMSLSELCSNKPWRATGESRPPCVLRVFHVQ